MEVNRVKNLKRNRNKNVRAAGHSAHLPRRYDGVVFPALNQSPELLASRHTVPALMVLAEPSRCLLAAILDERSRPGALLPHVCSSLPLLSHRTINLSCCLCPSLSTFVCFIYICQAEPGRPFPPSLFLCYNECHCRPHRAVLAIA